MIAIASPRKKPYFSRACAAYSEQLGVKRQVAGVQREIPR